MRHQQHRQHSPPRHVQHQALVHDLVIGAEYASGSLWAYDVTVPWNPSGGKREEELEYLLNPRVKKFIEDQGIILTTWRELKERRDAVGAK